VGARVCVLLLQRPFGGRADGVGGRRVRRHRGVAALCGLERRTRRTPPSCARTPTAWAVRPA
jgi:hypothetical protein